jgi:hypothetical protein
MMRNVVQENLQKLGHKVTDRVTGFKGVITSMTFDLYGCIQAVVTPQAETQSQKIEDSRYFDIQRLKITSKNPVMDVPAFVSADKGPAEKPAIR